MRRLHQSLLAISICPCFLMVGAANASVVEKAQEWLNNALDQVGKADAVEAEEARRVL